MKIVQGDMMVPNSNLTKEQQRGDLQSPAKTPLMFDIPCQPVEPNRAVLSPTSRQKKLRLEEPLTPQTPGHLPKRAELYEELHDNMLLDFSAQAQDADSQIMEILGVTGAEASQIIEHESLNVLDAIARMIVPILDQSLPRPPWADLVELCESHARLQMQRQILEEALHHIPIVRQERQDRHEVQWKIFNEDSISIDFDDMLVVDDELVDRLLGAGEQVSTSSDLTWKPDGLQFLRIDIDFDNEHIGYNEVRTNELSALIRKRKLDLQDLEQDDQNLFISNTRSLHPPDGKQYERYALLSGARNDANRSILPGLDEQFTTASALTNFLGVRKKRRQTEGSSYFVKTAGGSACKIAESIQETPAQFSTNTTPQSTGERQIKGILEAPMPTFVVPKNPVSVIVSSAVLRRRGLMKHLMEALPRINLVERDFEAYNTITWATKSVNRSPVASPLTYDADFIVSPTVGIILTTLQRVRQRPLPGQKGKVAILDRLHKASLRYERLVVLVSEDREQEISNGPDARDAHAMTEFIAFVSGLTTSVSTYFVARSELVLAKWLAFSIVQHILPDVTLSNSETQWELILRRLGLNAFAAQSVLGALRAPPGVDISSPCKAGIFGLTAFVEMDATDRLKHFGDLCGQAIIARVSAALESCWT